MLATFIGGDDRCTVCGNKFKVGDTVFVYSKKYFTHESPLEMTYTIISHENCA